ncbi:hypothetical protein [Caulobacter sp. NIBR2454]|uniref:hypothetical protein n=1 Tax=Caulobacter sp. NIBR2454 TaxID=3015996 RepID=UPI0022B7412F|nr:hypothetical protein [Caulobacter sp. NIBR2454]
MMSATLNAYDATEVRLAPVEDEARLSQFIQGFLSENGYPFIMVHADGSGARKVVFEDAALSRRFNVLWRRASRSL